MANLLYLAHRLPYPPNKGDKVRSYHLLKHLAARHRVFLGTFIDDPADEVHVEKVAGLCAGLHVVRLRPRVARAASLRALSSGESMTTRYYRDRGLQAWVDATCRSERIDAALAGADADRLRRCGFRKVESIFQFPGLAAVLALSTGKLAAPGL